MIFSSPQTGSDDNSALAITLGIFFPVLIIVVAISVIIVIILIVRFKSKRGQGSLQENTESQRQHSNNKYDVELINSRHSQTSESSDVAIDKEEEGPSSNDSSAHSKTNSHGTPDEESNHENDNDSSSGHRETGEQKKPTLLTTAVEAGEYVASTTAGTVSNMMGATANLVAYMTGWNESSDSVKED